MVSKFQKDLRKELTNIEKTFESTISSPQMRKVGDFSVNLIRKRTKLGFGVSIFYDGNKDNTRNSKRRLLRLSSAYVEHRQLLKKRGMLDSTTSPRKSNLTNTGQMLRALKVVSAKKGNVIIKTQGRRKDGEDNEQVAEWVSDAGRPWLDLTTLEQKQAARYYQNKILQPKLAKI